MWLSPAFTFRVLFGDNRGVCAFRCDDFGCRTFLILKGVMMLKLRFSKTVDCPTLGKLLDFYLIVSIDNGKPIKIFNESETVDITAGEHDFAFSLGMSSLFIKMDSNVLSAKETIHITEDTEICVTIVKDGIHTTINKLPEQVNNISKEIARDSNMNDTKYFYSGYNADLSVYEDRIVISGKFINKGMGEKTIPMSSISAVQIKPSTLLVNGFIAFNVLGEVATSSTRFGSGADSRLSENTVIVKNRNDDKIIKEIKNYVENAKSKSTATISQTVIQQNSSADELKKFKELLDQGIITQEEFDAKKKQLLGL